MLRWNIHAAHTALQASTHLSDLCPSSPTAKWAYSKRSCNCLCRMIALRTCLRIPYAITCLAYAGDFSDMALREAYAGAFVIVRLGTAYASLLWLHFLSFWPFVASFPFILAFCAFHNNVNVWFVLLRGQWLLPPYLQKRGGPISGAISCLRRAYAEVTRRLRGFHLHYVVGNFSIYNPLNGSFLVLPFLFTCSFLQSSGILPNLSDLTQETLRNMLANKKLTPAYADLSFPYAGRPYDKAPT